MRARRLLIPFLAAVCLAAAGCSEEEVEKAADDTAAETTEQQPAQEEDAPAASAAPRPKPKIAKPTGVPPKKLVVEDLIQGKGPAAKAGDQIRVNYVGVSFKSGEEFDSSFKTGRPFELALGAGMVIPGWDRGLVGMKVGGRRRLTIPPDLAYGEQGSPPAIGPNETLVFVIDLLGARGWGGAATG
jgi:peptidylprolyl isomerase